MIKIAKKYLEEGLSVIPVLNDKRPDVRNMPFKKDKNGYLAFDDKGNHIRTWSDFQKRMPFDAEISKMFADTHGIAIICGAVSGNLCVIDIDVKNDPQKSIGKDFLHILKNERPELYGKLVIETTINKGLHLFFRSDNVLNNAVIAKNDNGRPLIELLANGKYVVCSPTKGYSLIQNDFTKVPALSNDEYNCLLSICKRLSGNKQSKAKPIPNESNDFQKPDIGTIRHALTYFESRPDYDTWFKIINSLRSIFDDATVKQLISERFPEEKPGEIDEKLRYPAERIGIGTFFHLAKQRGFSFEKPLSKSISEKSPPTAGSLKEKYGIESGDQLLARDIPPLKWLIEDFLPEGLTVLAARPKTGKSYLMLYLSLIIANGKNLFDRFETNKVKVLFITLDDSKRLTKERMEQLITNETELDAANLDITEQFSTMDEDAIAELEQLIAENYYQMIVIDTLQLFIGQAKSNDIYDSQYKMINRIKELTRIFRNSVVLVTHLNKQHSQMDKMDAVMGTTGITGGADSIFLLVKKDDEIILNIRGKSIIDREIKLEFDYEIGKWKFLGESGEYRQNSAKEKIMKLMLSLPDGTGLTSAEISEKIGLNPNTCRVTLKRLFDSGKLTNGNGCYKVPGAGQNVTESLNFN